MKKPLCAVKLFARRPSKIIVVAAAILVAASCAPRPQYRRPTRTTPAISRAPKPPSVVRPTPEISKKPLPQEAKIREQDLKSSGSLPSTSATDGAPDASAGENRATTAEPDFAPLPDDSSLLAKITPATSPRRAASLRLTEEGRKLLAAGDAQKALTRLEKTIVIDSTNAYGYFYLARAQYRLGRYKQSLNFLDVAESRLKQEPFWLAEVHALRGENYRALGMMQQAEASYAQALLLNSGNRTAVEATFRLEGEAQPASR